MNNFKIKYYYHTHRYTQICTQSLKSSSHHAFLPSHPRGLNKHLKKEKKKGNASRYHISLPSLPFQKTKSPPKIMLKKTIRTSNYTKPEGEPSNHSSQLFFLVLSLSTPCKQTNQISQRLHKTPNASFPMQRRSIRHTKLEKVMRHDIMSMKKKLAFSQKSEKISTLANPSPKSKKVTLKDQRDHIYKVRVCRDVLVYCISRRRRGSRQKR
jgi:hypothetical protein